MIPQRWQYMHTFRHDCRDGRQQRVWAAQQDGLHSHDVEHAFVEEIDTAQDAEAVVDRVPDEKAHQVRIDGGIQSRRRQYHLETQGVSVEYAQRCKEDVGVHPGKDEEKRGVARGEGQAVEGTEEVEKKESKE